MMTTADVARISAVFLAGIDCGVELLAKNDDVRDELVEGLCSLGFQVVSEPDTVWNPLLARVRILEEGTAPPPGDTPFVVIAPRRCVAAFESAIEAGASGYFIRPVEALSLVATLRGAAATRACPSEKQTARIGDNLTADQTINTVVGILMERLRYSRDDAYARLRRHSRAERRKLVDVATQIIDANEKLSRTLQLISRAEPG
jgi:hypothetical protein